MNETSIPESTASNLLFSLLGGICAIIVGIAIFESQTLKAPPARNPSSEAPISDPRLDLPVLD